MEYYPTSKKEDILPFIPAQDILLSDYVSHRRTNCAGFHA
jgi:hypothetical protein